MCGIPVSIFSGNGVTPCQYSLHVFIISFTWLLELLVLLVAQVFSLVLFLVFFVDFFLLWFEVVHVLRIKTEVQISSAKVTLSSFFKLLFKYSVIARCTIPIYRKFSAHKVAWSIQGVSIRKILFPAYQILY